MKQHSKTIIFLFFLLIANSCQRATESHSLENAQITYNAQKLPIGADGCSLLTARIRTAKGNIDFCFFPRQAPTITNRFSQLAESGFYDGLNFHRVIPGQIVQTGDPSGSGSGGSKQLIRPEFNNLPVVRGSVVMAQDGIAKSYDSQFYIALNGLPAASNKGIVFGQVINGYEILEQLSQGDKLITLSLISAHE